MNDEAPVSCVATGGREIPAEGGNIYDHFSVNYLYPNGFRAFVSNRQDEGCQATKNAGLLHHGYRWYLYPFTALFPRVSKGRTPGPGAAKNMICISVSMTRSSLPFVEHQPINNGKRMATSTLLGMMGRMSAHYTGQQNHLGTRPLNSQEVLVPEHLD